MKLYTVFYAGLIYGEYDKLDNETRLSLPDDCYIYVPGKKSNAFFRVNDEWCRKDFTPRQPHDVPPELLMSVMLMS